MFTGLVEATATVRRTTAGPDAAAGTVRLELDDPWAAATAPGEQVRAGDSVAVDGVCLTALPRAPGSGVLAFDLGHETRRRTTLGALRPGAAVHLERALCFGARLGGHLVAGHVDAVGELVVREVRGDSLYLGVRTSPEVVALSAPQGSVTLAGVSLTITELQRDVLYVCLVPHTVERTYLGKLAVGASLNCEADLLARYLQRLVTGHPWAPPAAAATGSITAAGERP